MTRRPPPTEVDAIAAHETTRRARFARHEVLRICAKYDLGDLVGASEFVRGSARSPKMVVTTSTGRYLVKRREPGQNDPFRVAFTHALQLHLVRNEFPLPRLLGTRQGNNSMLQMDGHVYEVFEYVEGTPYDRSEAQTADAGATLGLLHLFLTEFVSEWEPPAGAYHDAPGVRERFNALERRGLHVAPLAEAYQDAAHEVRRAGFALWDAQVIHGDWHPGNMLFRGERVAGVIDYESARIAPRALDIAYGALQFSFLTGGETPLDWPLELDEGRCAAFCGAYREVQQSTLSKPVLATIPHLMIEALVAEAAHPIAATGTFHGTDGAGFIDMIVRKCDWIRRHAPDLLDGIDT